MKTRFCFDIHITMNSRSTENNPPGIYWEARNSKSFQGVMVSGDHRTLFGMYMENSTPTIRH